MSGNTYATRAPGVGALYARRMSRRQICGHNLLLRSTMTVTKKLVKLLSGQGLYVKKVL